MDALNSYWEKVTRWCEPFPLTSRLAPLRGFGGAWVKRDDELSFGVSGSKLRKWAAILATLRAQKIDEVVLSGSALSNNILAALQLLREVGVRPTLFLKRAHQSTQDGNALWFRLLKGDANIITLTDDEWPERHVREAAYLANAETAGKRVARLDEGASHPWALPGAASLGLDLLRGERKCGRTFRHIVVDAGTGYMAQSLIAVLGTLAPERHVHVVLMAGSEESFRQGLKAVTADWRRFSEASEGEGAPYTIYEPATARSFGATNRQVFGEVRRMAQEEGILVDPLYTAKLFYTLRGLGLSPAEDVLVVHSGGALTLGGFAKEIFC